MADEKPNYASVNRKVWNTSCFRSLSKEAQQLFFYLVTCPHGNMLGIFILRPGYAIDDLQLTDRQSFDKPFKELLSKQLFKYDENTQIILDMEQIVKHPPINPNQVTAGIKLLNQLPKTYLFHDLKLLCESLNKPFLEPLIESLGKRYAYTETETETESETEAERPAEVPPVDNSPKKDLPFEDEKLKKELNDTYGKILNLYPKFKIQKFFQLYKNKHPKAIIHTFSRLIEQTEKTGEVQAPWAYCEKIITLENMNYNEQDHISKSAEFKKPIDLVQWAQNLKGV